MDFLDIILEARGNKRRTTPASRTTRIDTTKEDEDTTDYTGEETDDNETIDATTDETDEETTDYTSETDDSDEETENDTTDDEPVDYTAEEEESDPEEDGADATDDATDDTTDDDSDSTDSGDEGYDTENSESGEEQDPKEKENMRILLEDFTNLYFMVRNTIAKLSNIDKSNAVINKIVTQISSNLNILKKQLFDFIVFNFSKGKYVTNLYKYNYFLEAFKINVEMLKKINVFTTNSQNN